MRKSTSASTSDPQKSNFVPCRCPGNPKLALGSDRPPLATIQEEAAQKPRLTTSYQKKIYHEMEEKSKRAISPMLTTKRSHGLSKAPKVLSVKIEPGQVTSSRRKSGSQKETQLVISQPIFMPWAESTSITQKARSTLPRLHPVIHSVALSVSSGSKFSTADTVLVENKENRSQTDLKERPARHSMDLKEFGCQRACDLKASTSQVKAPRYSESKTSAVHMQCNAKEKQITYERSQLKTSQTTVNKLNLKSTVGADLSRSSTRSSSSSGYISTESTKSNSKLKSDGKLLQIAQLDSQNFKTLAQNTLSFTCPSYSCSSKNPTKSSACLPVSEAQKSKIPTWEAVSLAAQKGKVTLIRDTSLTCEDEMPFVPMEQFIQDLDKGKGRSIKTVPVSPCSINWIPRRSNVSELDNNSIPKPAVKTTLTRNKKQRTLPPMYTPDYDEIIITYCFQLRTCFLATRELVNAYINQRSRTCVVEWILKVSNYITPVESVFYMSVRLFDFAVISLKLHSRLYQLAAIAAFWISAKYLADIKIEVPKLCSFCDVKFSKQEILSMEKQILRSTHFCLSMADPLDFLNYYLKISNLDEDEVLRYGASFVLECSTMSDLYAYTEPTLLVAASLYLAYRIVKQSNSIGINFIWYQKVDLATYANDVLKGLVLRAIKHQLEPAQKYSSAKKLFVAKFFV